MSAQVCSLNKSTKLSVNFVLFEYKIIFLKHELLINLFDSIISYYFSFECVTIYIFWESLNSESKLFSLHFRIIDNKKLWKITIAS